MKTEIEQKSTSWGYNCGTVALLGVAAAGLIAFVAWAFLCF